MTAKLLTHDGLITPDIVAIAHRIDEFSLDKGSVTIHHPTNPLAEPYEVSGAQADEAELRGWRRGERGSGLNHFGSRYRTAAEIRLAKQLADIIAAAVAQAGA